MARWNVRAQASCFIAAIGYKRRRVMRARLVFWRWGVNGMGANAVHKKPAFYSVFQNKRVPLLAAVKDLNNSHVVTTHRTAIS